MRLRVEKWTLWITFSYWPLPKSVTLIIKLDGGRECNCPSRYGTVSPFVRIIEFTGTSGYRSIGVDFWIRASKGCDATRCPKTSKTGTWNAETERASELGSETRRCQVNYRGSDLRGQISEFVRMLRHVPDSGIRAGLRHLDCVRGWIEKPGLHYFRIGMLK